MTFRFWWIRVAWALAAVLIVWAISWAAMPWLIRHQLEKIATEQLGRAVTVGAVDFRPWTLEVTLQDIAVASRDGKSRQLDVRRVYIDAEIESLVRLAPVIQRLEIDAPHLRVVHTGGGAYDFDDILARLAPPQSPAEPAGEPLQFALFNVAVRGGAVDFDDRSVGQVHTVRELALGVPFLSNLASRRDVTVEPKLDFVLNGSRFASAAQATPFAPSRKTDATFRLQSFDLAPYLAYLPPSMPVRLEKAMLAADIRLAFVQQNAPSVTLVGTIDLTGVKLSDRASNNLLAFDAMKIALDDVRPLERIARIGSVELSNPWLEVRRDAAGRLNVDMAGPSTGAAAAPPVASAASSSVAAVAAVTAVPAASAAQWQISLARLTLRNGTATWNDAVVSPPAALRARDIALELAHVQWPMAEPIDIQGSAVLERNGLASAAPPRPKPASGRAPTAPPPAANAARLQFSGSATDQQASVKVSIGALPIDLAAPYLSQFLVPALRGTVDTQLQLRFNAPQRQLAEVAVESLVVQDVALVSPSAPGSAPPLASIRKIQVADTRVDVARQTLAIGRLAIDQPRIPVVRGEDKQWMVAQWLRPVATPTASTVAPAKVPAAARTGRGAQAATAASATPTWRVSVSDLSVEGGNLAYLDKSTPKPVAFELSALRLAMKNASPDNKKPSPLAVSGRIRTARGEPGQLDYRGSLQMQPLIAQGAVVATGIPLHAFEPYFGGDLHIEVLRADAGFKGRMRYADGPRGATLQLGGDAVLEDFRANSLAANDGGLQIAEELLSWKTLNLRGLDLAAAPGTPTTLAIQETTLSDFFARVIVYENGRINLQDLVKASPASDAVPAQPAGAVPAVVVGSATVSTAAVAAPAAAVVAAPTALDPVITIGPVSMINGKVYFSDRFVKPNYSANLSDLTGKLSGFSSVASAQGTAPQLADLELRGRAEGTASLEILGKLNPLAKPLALDIQGKVRDLELPPLSPYSVKYAGYGIERGKLSVDVSYRVLPSGQLTASNKLVLNQLTFGDKVDGAPASLPVKLAVALLADRNGVIDIDLPVSGSLNDPQFRLGPIIFRVIVNLIVKAVTAPFSLLASAFGGGGDELGTVAFAPGSAALTSEARVGLDKVAKALTDRPALRMTVVGTANLESEREAYKRERLHALLLAEKRRLLVTSGVAGAAQQAQAVTSVSEAETPALLQEVFKRADIAKPRNLIGMVKDIPQEDMEALLLANIPVTDDAIRALALQRGVAVKDYLGSRQLAAERLFLGAAKPVAADGKWSPRAELSLTSN